jgi:hypothetical protein
METATQIVAELEQIIAKARPVPLTDQVRIDRKRVEELLRQLREALEVGRVS